MSNIQNIFFWIFENISPERRQERLCVKLCNKIVAYNSSLIPEWAHKLTWYIGQLSRFTSFNLHIQAWLFFWMNEIKVEIRINFRSNFFHFLCWKFLSFPKMDTLFHNWIRKKVKFVQLTWYVNDIQPSKHWWTERYCFSCFWIRTNNYSNIHHHLYAYE